MAARYSLVPVLIPLLVLLLSCAKQERVRTVYQFPAVLTISPENAEDGPKYVKKSAVTSQEGGSEESASEGNRHSAMDDEITPEEAAEAYRATLKTDPDNFNAYFNLGSIYSELGLYDRAIESYRNAAGIRPDHAELRYNKGLTHLMYDDKEAALDEFKILRDLDKGLADSLYEAIVQNVVWNSNYFLQVAAYKNPGYADDMMEKLKGNLVCAFIEKDKTFNRVIIPGIKTVKQGRMMIKDINRRFGLEPFLLKAFKVQ